MRIYGYRQTNVKKDNKQKIRKTKVKGRLLLYSHFASHLIQVKAD